MSSYINPRARALVSAAEVVEQAATFWAILTVLGPILWALLVVEPNGIVVLGSLVTGGAVAWMGWSIAGLLAAIGRGYAEQLERLTTP